MNDRIDPPGAESEGHGPEDAGLSVDEKFARLVAEIGGAGAAAKPAPKEEAARTRELRAKWSKNPPQAVGWRTDGPSLPEPAPAEKRRKVPRQRRRSTGSKWLPVAFIVVLLLGVAAFLKHAGSTQAAPINVSPAGTEQPWAQGDGASPSVSYANPDDAYFAGTPALGWKNNEAGFSVPVAKEIHGVDSDDIATGYELLEKVMEAGNLDATILDGGSTGDFTALLDPSSPPYHDLAGWIAHPSYQDDPTMLVSRFDPATTRLLGHTVKVSGSMSESAGPQSGTAYLTANYVFVYAVGPAKGGSALDTLVTVHRTVQIEIFNSAEYQVDSSKAWIYNYSADTSNITCYDYNGFIDPGFGGSGAVPDVSGVADPYDTGNLLTPSAAPSPTSTLGACQAESGY